MPTNLALFYGLSPLLEHLVDQSAAFSLPVSHEAHGRCFPLVQLLEDEAALRLYASIPGAAPDSLHLDLMPGRLVIRGNLPAPCGTRLRVERPTGPFRRDLPLPCCVTGEGAQAAMRDGILAVTLPKAASDTLRLILPITWSGGSTP